jgi:excinuclease UvrABC ATPase subunit
VVADRPSALLNCGAPIAGQSAEQIIDQVMELPEGERFMVMAPMVRGRKGEYGKLFEELRADGYSRVKVDGELRMLDDPPVLDKKFKHDISVVVDRLVMRGEVRKRLATRRDGGGAGRRDHRGGDPAARGDGHRAHRSRRSSRA